MASDAGMKDVPTSIATDGNLFVVTPVEQYLEARRAFNRSRAKEATDAAKDAAYRAVTASWYGLKAADKKEAGVLAGLMWH